VSKQSAQAFIATVNSDASMQAQTKNLKDLSGLIGFAETAGFRFTAAEWNEAAGSMALSAAGELSNKELDQVAGGGVQPTPFMGWGSRFLSPRVTTIGPCF